MHLSRSILLLGIAGLGHAAPRPSYISTVETLYTIDNKSPNHVIALPVAQNGSVLSEGTYTATGGNGGAFIAKDGVSPVATDSLNSQDAVVRQGNFLYVVNAGSNSISAFAIDPTNTTSLTLIGSPYETIGEFPNTIAVSLPLNMVCVGTAGAKNGVECFTGAVTGQLVKDGYGLRSFGLTEPGAPLFVSSTVSDVWFSSDLTRLFATVKGDGSKTSHGWLSVFRIIDGAVSTTEVRTVSDKTSQPFGAFENPYNPNSLFVSDTGIGAVVYDVEHDGAASLASMPTSSSPIPAACWAEWSPVSDVAWVTGPEANTLLAYNVVSGALISQSNVTAPTVGLIDFVVPGNYLYALSPGAMNGTKAGIVVVDISKGVSNLKTMQFATIGYGADNYAHGLAYYA